MNHRIIGVLTGIVIIAVVGFLVLVTILLFPASAPAAPTIAWTPAAVTSEVARGYSKTVPVLFTSSENAANVQLSVVPELQPFVQVNPAAFATINKGQTASVTVTLSASRTAPFGKVNGTIRLRIGKTLAKALPVSLLVTVVPLPPDPGSAGKATLQGSDSDVDGVRDDLQRYIALTYPESARTRAALTQYAVAIQNSLLNAGDRDASIVNGRSRIEGMDCLDFILGNSIKANDAFQRLRAQALNTLARSRAYLDADRHMGGQVITVPRRSELRLSCSFDPDSLEN